MQKQNGDPKYKRSIDLLRKFSAQYIEEVLKNYLQRAESNYYGHNNVVQSL